MKAKIVLLLALADLRDPRSGPFRRRQRDRSSAQNARRGDGRTDGPGPSGPGVAPDEEGRDQENDPRKFQFRRYGAAGPGRPLERRLTGRGGRSSGRFSRTSFSIHTQGWCSTFSRKEKITYAGEEDGQDRATVKTVIQRVNEEIPVDYYLADGKGRLTGQGRVDRRREHRGRTTKELLPGHKTGILRRPAQEDEAPAAGPGEKLTRASCLTSTVPSP